MNAGGRWMFFSACGAALVTVITLQGATRLGAEEPNPEATRLYNSAAGFHNVGSWDLAAKEWQTFIDSFPHDPRIPRALHYLGVCLFNQHQYEAAAQAFQKSLEKETDSGFRELSAVYRGMAIFEAARAGKPELFATARSLMEEYLRAFPQGKQRSEAEYYLAETLYFQGQKDQAAQAYRRFLQSYPGTARAADALYALGVCEEELGNRKAALQSYQTFIEKHPQHPRMSEVLYRLGEVHYALGNYEEAELAFRKAGTDSRFSNADLAVIRFGDALVQLKRFDEAAQQYASVEKRFLQSPYVARANVGAARCFYYSNRYQEALAILLRVIQNPDVQPEAAHWAARCYLRLGQPQLALQLLKQEMVQAAPSPWNATLQLDRADALYEIPEQREAAIGEYARAAALATEPGLKGEALYAAAHTALGLGKIPLARQFAEQFRQQLPEHVLSPDIAHILGECELAENRYDTAAQIFEDLLKKYPKNPQAGMWQARQLAALQLAGKHESVVKLAKAVVNAVSQADDQAAILTLLAASQLELNDPEGAQESLLAALQQSPKGSSADRAMLLLAWAYQKQGRLPDARSVLERMIRDFAESPLLDRAYFDLGKCGFALGDLDAAESAYRELLRRFPQSSRVPAAMGELAQTLLKKNQRNDAEQILSELLRRFSNDPLVPWARYLLAGIYYEKQQPDQAMQMVEEALRGGLSGNDRSSAMYMQGLILIEKKEYDRAAAIFEQILKENAQYPEADKVLYQWAWARKLANREAEAVSLFQQLFTQYPRSRHQAEAKYHVASALYSQGRYQEAAFLYHECYKTAESPDLVEKAVHRLGWCYFKTGEYDKAAQTFAYQRGKYSQSSLAIDAAFMEAESLFMQNKFDQALYLYGMLPPLESPDYEVLRLLHAGQSAAQLKQIDKALQYFSQLQSKFNDTPEAIQAAFEIGMIYFDRNQDERALQEFQKVLAQPAEVPDETVARSHFMIGEIEMRGKRYEEAVKSFFRVAYGYRLPQWQAAALFEAAKCLESLKRPEQAAKLYQELIEKFPESAQVADARAKLQTLRQQ